MNDILEDCGNAVRINGTVVPAMCIRVENVPGIIDGYWYNPYFEVPFEGGTHLVVEDLRYDEGGRNRMFIYVEVYINFNACHDRAFNKTFNTWDEFLKFFESIRKSVWTNRGVFS